MSVNLSKVTFFLNGDKISYNGNPSARLLDVLRGELGLTGTKCGCKEGECGACAVLINGRLVNSCLVAVGSLERTTVVTIEGYTKSKRFTALDEAYASQSAVQCGFCIPGMILASESILASNPEPTEEEIRTGISGNLCRCTGYNSIVRAVGIAAKTLALQNADGGDADNSCGVDHECGARCDAGLGCDPDAGANGMMLTEALVLRKNNPELIPYTGGTDLMVSGECEKGKYLFLSNIPDLRNIYSDDNFIRFGAACTFSNVIEHPLTPEILKEACKQIAAPAIRNAGTIGGNIANGSAKADSALIFVVTDSLIRLSNINGERTIPVRDFYLGGGKTLLANDELIVEVLMPKTGIDNYYYKKVGARNALSIARTSFAGILDIKEGIIDNCAVAFGAVIDVIIRFDDIDNMLIGKTIEEAKALKEDYIAAYDKAIIPRRGRVSIEYRKDVCINLLRDFLEQSGI